MTGPGQDIRTAYRGLSRAKAFTAAATLTLALGITGTTVMFAVVDGVLLRPLPVRDQDRLMLAWKELRSSRFGHYPFGGPDVEALTRTDDVAGADSVVVISHALWKRRYGGALDSIRLMRRRSSARCFC